MIVSSRTPEGESNRCPVCGCDLCVEPSRPFGDAPCPSCGHLLWFVNLGGDIRYFDGEQAVSARERLVQVVSEQLGVPAEELHESALLKKFEADSLDLVELAMELEEATDG